MFILEIRMGNGWHKDVRGSLYHCRKTYQMDWDGLEARILNNRGDLVETFEEKPLATQES